MLTYQDVVTVKLTPLTTAATSWDEMGDAFEELGDAYAGGVLPVARDGSWVGASADAADPRLTTTRTQFDSAAVESRAIASILRDIHGQFTERITVVKNLVHEAKAAGVHIDAQGRAHVDPSKEESTEGGIFDAPRRMALEARRRSAEAEWTDAIATAVRAVDDADQGAKLALRDAAGIKGFLQEAMERALGTAHDFNGNAVGDIEVVEAREANAYADQVLAGEEPSDPEEYARLMRDNAGDEKFSKTVLNHVGPEGLIKLTNQMNTFAYDSDTGNKQHYLGAEQGLANSLATATRDPESKFSKNFTAGLKEAGVKRYDWQGEEVRGYQSLVTLMQHGEGYSEQLLHELGDDMIAIEKADKGNDTWDLPKKFVGPRDEWFANDPLDGLLGVMSKDPEAAATFLDPESDSYSGDSRTDGNDRLEYLTRQRDWEVVDGNPVMRSPFDPDSMWGDPLSSSDILDRNDRAGFGAALVAGTTGIDPNNSGGGYVEHSDANDRVFKAALEHLAAEGNDFPPSLRTDMAVVMGNNGNEVHAAASAQEVERSPLKREEVLEVSKQISRDRYAYFTLQDSINREILHDIKTGEGGAGETWRKAGHTIGFLEEARYQGLAVDADDAKAKAAWDAKMDYHTWGGVVNFIPYAGDYSQREIDVLTSKWLEGETDKINAGLAADNSESYLDREKRIGALADIWRDTNPDDQRTRDEVVSDINGKANDGNRTARGLPGGGS